MDGNDLDFGREEDQEKETLCLSCSRTVSTRGFDRVCTLVGLVGSRNFDERTKKPKPARNGFDDRVADVFRHDSQAWLSHTT